MKTPYLTHGAASGISLHTLTQTDHKHKDCKDLGYGHFHYNGAPYAPSTGSEYNAHAHHKGYLDGKWGYTRDPCVCDDCCSGNRDSIKAHGGTVNNREFKS